jgi:hypothetical protein
MKRHLLLGVCAAVCVSISEMAEAQSGQQPFNGAPVSVPATVQAEQFDLGGEGLAYHDNVPGNAGGAFRTAEDVDIIAAVGNASGYIVNNFETGEWLEYTIQAAAFSSYRISLHVSSQYTTSRFHLEIDGTSVTSSILVPNTGHWSAFTFVTAGTVTLAAGPHVLRIYSDEQYFNLDAIQFESAQAPYTGTPAAVPGTFRAEDFDGGGEGVAYHDNVPGNAGGAFRTAEDVDIIAAVGNATGFIVNNFETGEWLEYTINVAATSTYTVSLHASSAYTTSRFHLEVDGTSVSDSISVPMTGAWSAFTMVPVNGIALSAGTHVLSIHADTQYFNLDAVQITDDAGECLTTHVDPGGNLQAAINAATPCHTITLTAGATYPGNFVLPPRTGPGYVTLTTRGPIPAAGQRVTPSASGTLAKLQSPNNQPAITAASGASKYRLTGLEFLPSIDPRGDIIIIGNPEETVSANQADDIVLDRVLARGHPTNGQKRGVGLHGTNLSVINSWISDIKGRGQDTQAILIVNGRGPYTIRNNYLEGAGENLLVGGDDPRIQGLVPADILIEDNTIAKPLAWNTLPEAQAWTVKNLLELKLGERVTIRRNVLSGNWSYRGSDNVGGGAQTGWAVVITVRNQGGRAPWSVVKDVLFEYNVIYNVSSGISIHGDDDEHPSQRTTNVTIRHSLVITNKAVFAGQGWFMMTGRAPQYLTVERNTTDIDGCMWWQTYDGGSVTTSQGLVVRDNLTLHHRESCTQHYGFWHAPLGRGNAALAAYPGYVFTGNVLAGGPASGSGYPAGNSFPTFANFKAQFIDWDGGDYHLIPNSTYTGKGVDFTGLPTP